MATSVAQVMGLSSDGDQQKTVPVEVFHREKLRPTRQRSLGPQKKARRFRDALF
jgi:hypothetical protein